MFIRYAGLVARHAVADLLSIVITLSGVVSLLALLGIVALVPAGNLRDKDLIVFGLSAYSAFAFFVLVPYRIWRDDQERLDDLKAKLQTATPRTVSQVGNGVAVAGNNEGYITDNDITVLQHLPWLNDETIRGEKFSLQSILTSGLLADRVFIECTITGPSLIALAGRFTSFPFTDCQFNGPTTEEEMLWPIKKTRAVGVVGYRDCSFVRCTFVDIGIVGPPSTIRYFAARLRRVNAKAWNVDNKNFAGPVERS